MKVQDFMEKLKAHGYQMQGIEVENKYTKVKNDDVKVGLYARISKRDSNNKSIESQFMTLKLLLKSINPSIQFKLYEDYGISGTTVLRSGYNALINDIENGEVNIVMATNIDRFGRRADNILSVLYPQNKDGFIFVSYDDKLVNTFQNRGDVTKCAADAESVITVYSKKTRRGMETKMLLGSYVGSQPPFGLRKIKIGDRVTLMPAGDISTIIVREIFNNYLSGCTLSEIVQNLNEKGYKTPKGNSKWEKSTVEGILKNIKYAGIMAQGLYRKKGPFADGESSNIIRVDKKDWKYGEEFQGIVTIEEFNRVQNMLKENRSVRTSKSRHLFSGLIKCGDCGRALIFKKVSKGYKCSGNQIGNGCTTHLVKEEELFNLVKGKIVEYINNNLDEIRINLKNKFTQSSNSDFYKRQITEIESKISQFEKIICDSYTDFKNKKMDEFLYNIIIEQNKKEIEELKHHHNILLRKLESSIIDGEKIQTILNDLDSLIFESNKVLKIMIKRIEIYENNQIKIIWRY